VFAFPPVATRFVRLVCEPFEREQSIEIVEANLYDPADAAKVLEPGRLDALGHAPVTVQAGESTTVDFGYVRAPLGALVAWGETHGIIFSVYLSDDGQDFSEVGRITTGDGGADSFWWRSTTARYFRLTVHEASGPRARLSTSSSCASSTRTGCQSAPSNGPQRRATASFTRGPFLAGKSTGPRSASSILPRRRCLTTGTALASDGQAVVEYHEGYSPPSVY
jgi:hypothetical protein